MRRRGRAEAALALVALLAASPLAAAPRRVVSLNPCLDAILLAVADPGQIGALSHYSRDPAQSTLAAQARRYPFTWGSGEEIAALRADLVLTSGPGPWGLAGVLARLGIPQARFAVPSGVEESLGQVDRIARLVGHPERGAALARRIRAAVIAAAPAPGEPRLGALVFEYHGQASGPGTLVDAMMRQAGFDNVASRYGLVRTGEVPLEAILADPPRVLLAGRLAPGEPTWADRVLSHPALARLAPKMQRESFPQPLIFCGGPSIAPAMTALAQARERALRGLSR